MNTQKKTNSFSRAAVFDRDDVITFLLEEGSDIEVELEGGLSLLLVAVASGASKTANLLLSKGADPLAKDSTGQGLLHKSVSYSRTLQALITVRHSNNNNNYYYYYQYFSDWGD